MNTKDKTRKPYQKPQVTQVKLEMEEAVLLACKTGKKDPYGRNNKGCGSPACKDLFGS